MLASVAAASVLAFVAAACSSSAGYGVPPTSTTTGPVAGRPLVIVRDLDIDSLDPQRSRCDTCAIFLSAVYETLVGLGVDGHTLEPRLATSWSVDAGLTTFTFHLDPAATFADGSPVEAGDVAWSWQRLADLDGPAASLVTGLRDVAAPDVGTVVATFDGPNSAFPAIVTSPYLSVVNRDVAEAGGASEAWFGASSAGSGPYVLADHVPGRVLRLLRNERYWGPAAPFPSVVLDQEPDADGRRVRLAYGEADIAMQLSEAQASDLEGDDLEVDGVEVPRTEDGSQAGQADRARRDLVVRRVASDDLVYLALDPSAPGSGTELTPDVRRAMALAIDYEGMVDDLTDGTGHVQRSPVPDGMLGGATVAGPRRDVAEARRLLAASGHASGFTIEATYPELASGGIDLATLMDRLERDLAAVGITLEVTPVDGATWAAQVDGPGVPLTVGYATPDHPDPSQYVRRFGLVDGSTWGRRVGGGTPVVDPVQQGLLEAALAQPDGATRDATYGELAEAMAGDGYIVALFSPETVLAYRSDLTGVEASVCCELELGRIGLGP